MKWFDFIRNVLKKPSSLNMQKGRPIPELLRKMLGQLVNTQDIELTCDEVLALMDQFAEAAQRGEDVARLMPRVQQHLEMCPDCRGEYEALLRILKSAPI